MKTFNDLVFKEHHLGGKHATIFFDNGYGASVVHFPGGYHNDGEWEIAVLKGNEKQSGLCYSTPITDDVIGYQNDDDVTNVLKQIQELPKYK